MYDEPRSTLSPADEMVYALDQDVSELSNQIGQLAQVLMDEFGGPTENESACEMAIRVLREQKAEIEYLRSGWLTLAVATIDDGWIQVAPQFVAKMLHTGEQ